MTPTIIHEKTSLFIKSIFLSHKISEKSLFPKCLRRTSWPIRDLENFTFQNFKISKKVFPKKCRGIIPTHFLYSLPLFFLHFQSIVVSRNFSHNFFLRKSTGRHQRETPNRREREREYPHWGYALWARKIFGDNGKNRRGVASSHDWTIVKNYNRLGRISNYIPLIGNSSAAHRTSSVAPSDVDGTWASTMESSAAPSAFESAAPSVFESVQEIHDKVTAQT